MTQVNLLPWREQARQQNKNNFLIMLGITIAIALVLDIIIHFYISNLISSQQRSNDFISFQLNNAQANVTKLKKRKKALSQVFSELQFLYNLKNSSYKAVRLLDVLARVVPNGMTLTKIMRTDDDVTVIGKSKSNLQVTELMANISKAGIFKQPVLTEIAAKENEPTQEKMFQIKMMQWKA